MPMHDLGMGQGRTTSVLRVTGISQLMLILLCVRQEIRNIGARLSKAAELPPLLVLHQDWCAHCSYTGVCKPPNCTKLHSEARPACTALSGVACLAGLHFKRPSTVAGILGKTMQASAHVRSHRSCLHGFYVGLCKHHSVVVRCCATSATAPLGLLVAAISQYR